MQTHSTGKELWGEAYWNRRRVQAYHCESYLVHQTTPTERSRIDATIAGQVAALEAGFHALFLQEDTEAVLLIDASNAFNILNRQTVLLNIQ